MSGLNNPGNVDWFEANRRHVAELRDKYLNGNASPEEVEAYWIQAIQDPEELGLLKTEVNLKAILETRKSGRN